MTTHALSLVVGSTTIAISTGEYLLLDYVPTVPELGSTVVVETARLHIQSSSGANLQLAIRAIETFFAKVGRNQALNFGDKCYVHLQLASDSAVWRSEITDGRVSLSDDVLRLWANNSAEVTLSWSRQSYWESPLVALGLKRTGVTKTTAGVTIYNHHDSTTHENFVDIEGADILGSVQTPLQLQLTTTATNALREMFISANAFSAPSTLVATFEGEDSTANRGALGVTTTSATSSSGEYQLESWVSGINHIHIGVWAIPSAEVVKLAGGRFRVLMRLASLPSSDCYARIHVKFDDVYPDTTIYSTQEILISDNALQDFGSIPLPPNSLIGGTPSGVSLVLTLRSSVADSIGIDYVQLAGPDGYHRFEQLGFQLPSGSIITDDGPEGQVYATDGPSGPTIYIYSDYPPPIFIWPGKDTRIRVLWRTVYGCYIDESMIAKAWYRQRRLTV